MTGQTSEPRVELWPEMFERGGGTLAADEEARPSPRDPAAEPSGEDCQHNFLGGQNNVHLPHSDERKHTTAMASTEPKELSLLSPVGAVQKCLFSFDTHLFTRAATVPSGGCWLRDVARRHGKEKWERPLLSLKICLQLGFHAGRLHVTSEILAADVQKASSSCVLAANKGVAADNIAE